MMSSLYAVPCFGDSSVNVNIRFEYYGPNWDVVYDGWDNYLDVSSLVYHYSDTNMTPHWIRDDMTGAGGVPDGVVDGLDVSMLVYYYKTTWVVFP